MNPMFLGILMLAADTPEQLRKCDVYRVLNAANDKGELKEFAVWLKAQPVSSAVLIKIDKLIAEEFSE